ncbi:EamA family transporter RarD [Alkalihalobacterium alkalinitrilicum]|uniref:EamA family transporter RarD n=1 Tax=Alkalihalobacterium alkalinitrilicum TaxID=427920 RepID=UPI001EE43783|nr:EamA family transporter RarD [Alkalihalobacterium alkalinitrilicum]
MEKENSKEHLFGVLFGVGAYLLWGILPLYWKLLDAVPAQEVLAHRIVWCLVFMFIILFALGKFKSFIEEVRGILSQRKQLINILFASFLISINWFLFIWAVNNDHVIEVSLGYYINPIVNVILGVLVLKEKLSFWQAVAVLLAFVGVLHMTFQFGSIPWTALTLAVSFALYGLCKKVVKVGAMTGLTLETLFITPFALIFLVYISRANTSSFTLDSPILMLLFIGAGIATAIPLLLFASAARRISLSLIGFLQYIGPTIMLFLGIMLFQEPFTVAHFGSFLFIWIALIIFSLAKSKLFLRLEPKFLQKRKSFQG